MTIDVWLRKGAFSGWYKGAEPKIEGEGSQKLGDFFIPFLDESHRSPRWELAQKNFQNLFEKFIKTFLKNFKENSIFFEPIFWGQFFQVFLTFRGLLSIFDFGQKNSHHKKFMGKIFAKCLQNFPFSAAFGI